MPRLLNEDIIIFAIALVSFIGLGLFVAEQNKYNSEAEVECISSGGQSAYNGSEWKLCTFNTGIIQ